MTLYATKAPAPVPTGAGVKGARTRASIIATAGRTFAEHGYETATLDQIAAQLNLTRSAILFHFDSKRTLLFAVLNELLEELNVLYTSYEHLRAPLSGRKRRELFTDIVNTLAAHPEATALLTRDLSVGPLRWPDGRLVMSTRLGNLLHGPDPDRLTKLRAAAVMGIFMRGMSAPPNAPAAAIPLMSAEERAQVVECALAAFNAKLPSF